MTFVGPVEDPVPYYAAADALVLPSFYDPFGLVVLEAAACGLPVVTSRASGASELLSEGRDGYVLDDPADAASWADRLERLLDPALRRRMGEAARRLALQYTLERNCDALLAIYHELACGLSVAPLERVGRRLAEQFLPYGDHQFLDVSATWRQFVGRERRRSPNSACSSSSLRHSGGVVSSLSCAPKQQHVHVGLAIARSSAASPRPGRNRT